MSAGCFGVGRLPPRRQVRHDPALQAEQVARVPTRACAWIDLKSAKPPYVRDRRGNLFLL
jgi:hypothetical protein